VAAATAAQEQQQQQQQQKLTRGVSGKGSSSMQHYRSCALSLGPGEGPGHHPTAHARDAAEATSQAVHSHRARAAGAAAQPQAHLSHWASAQRASTPLSAGSRGKPAGQVPGALAGEVLRGIRPQPQEQRPRARQPLAPPPQFPTRGNRPAVPPPSTCRPQSQSQSGGSGDRDWAPSPPVSTAAQAGTAERGGSAGRAASDDGGVFGGDRACGGAMTAGAVGGSQAAGGGGAAGASVGQRLLAVADGFRSGAISEAQKRAAKVSVIAAANGEGGPSTPPRRASGGLIRLSHA
jgi:hypothetical protein